MGAKVGVGGNQIKIAQLSRTPDFEMVNLVAPPGRVTHARVRRSPKTGRSFVFSNSWAVSH